MQKRIIREQFNRQVDRFAEFELTRNRTIFQFIVDFCKFEQSDRLLDVACGSGAFVIFCSDFLQHAVGVDISNRQIQRAKCCSDVDGLANTDFLICDVETLPFHDASFDVVTCRSAFHHMEDCQPVLGEMRRVLKKGGKVCIQDMTSYRDSHVNDYFERMEKCIDVSHFRALSTEDIQSLLTVNQIQTEEVLEATLTHGLDDYIGHATQSKDRLDDLSELINTGLSDPALTEYLFQKDQSVFFKRGGVVIYGTVC